MVDLAPQRALQPHRPVVTVGELLGRTGESRPVAPNGRPARSSGVPDDPISVSALIRRAGDDRAFVRRPDAERCVEPRFDRTFTGLTTPRRRLITSAGAVLAVGSLAGAAILLGDVRPGPATAGASDAGYPGQRLPQQAGAPTGQAPDGLALDLATVAYASPLAPAGVGLPAAALSSGVLPSLPAGSGLAPAPRTGGFRPTSGGLVGTTGGVVGAVVSTGGGAVGGVVRSGGGLVGGTVNGLGRSLGPVGTPVRALGDTVTRTTGDLGGTVTLAAGALGDTVTRTTGDLGGTVTLATGALDDTVTRTTGDLGGTVTLAAGGLADLGGPADLRGRHRVPDGASTVTGPALSSLTAPITARDAVEGPVSSLVSGSDRPLDRKSRDGSSPQRSAADGIDVQKSIGGLSALGSSRSDKAKSGTRAKARGERRSVDGLLSAASSPLSKKRSTSSEKRSGSAGKRSSSDSGSGSVVERLGKAAKNLDRSDKGSSVSKKRSIASRSKDLKKRSDSSKRSSKKSGEKKSSKRSGALGSLLSGRD